MQLHPVGASGAPNDVERLVELESVALGQDPFRLLDGNARAERPFELGAALEVCFGDGEEPPHGGRRLIGVPDPQCLDGLPLGILAHGG